MWCSALVALGVSLLPSAVLSRALWAAACDQRA